MATAEYPIRALMEAVATAMAAAVGGATAEHKMGRKFDFANDRPPRYVWVPMRARPTDRITTKKAEQHRAIYAVREHVQVGCWGRTYDEVWAMRRNLAKAIHDQAFADAQIEPGDWERASEAWNQKGELFVETISIGLPYIDAYTPLEAAAEEPERLTVMPTVITANAQQTDDPAQLGEVGVDDISTAP